MFTVLFSVIMPENVSSIMISIMHIVNLDLINQFGAESLVASSFEETEPFNEKFEEAGYESSTFIIEIGPILYLIIIYIIGILLRAVLKKVLKANSDNWCTRFIRKPRQYRVASIRFVLEGCIEMGLAAMISMTRMNSASFSNVAHSISSVLAFVTLLALVFAPIYMIKEIKGFLSGEGNQLKRSQLFKGLKGDKSSLYYNVVFFARRYFMILVLTLLPSNRNVQINCQLVSSLAMMSYVTWVRPYESKLQNSTEIINEITVLLSSYHLFCFTEWVYDVDRRLEIGWSLVGFIVFNVIVNVVIFLVTIFKNFR